MTGLYQKNAQSFFFKKETGIALLLFIGLAAHAATSITRTSAFDYDPVSGLLRKEIVEPGNSTLCVVTEYDLDGYGRARATTVRNCNGSAGALPGAVAEAPAPAASAAFVSRTSRQTYSADQRFVATTTNALDQQGSTVFSARLGVPISLTGPNALTTQWGYDSFGRKILERRADGNGTRWNYQYCAGMPDVPSHATGTTLNCPTIASAVGAYAITTIPVKAPIDIVANTTGGASGPYNRAYYDALNRVIRVETQGPDVSGTSALIFQDTEYNGLGQIARRSNSYFNGQTVYWTSYTYDQLGRVKTEDRPTDSAPSGAITEVTYSGLTTITTNPHSEPVTEVKNVAGQVAIITDALNARLTHKYDPLGNLVETKDDKGNITSIVYDTAGRKTALYDPNMGVWRYSYNALGELVSQTDAKDQTTTMAYDRLGRLVRRADPTLTSYWHYDRYANATACPGGIGQLCEVVSSNGHVVKHNFDSMGRPLSTATTIGTTFTASVTYDALGRVATQTYPSGLVLRSSYTTGLGYLKSVIDARTNAALWTANSVNAAGQLLAYSYGNGVVTNNGYYAGTGRLNSMRAGLSSAPSAVQNLSHSHDDLGRLITRVDHLSGVTAGYSYDEINRLKTEARFGGGLASAQTMSWTYDTIGNMLTRTEGGVTNTYNYNPSGSGSRRPHAVAGVTGTVNGVSAPSYLFDENGNLTSGAGRTVNWTGFDKVRTISRGTARLEYVYGADRDRAQERYYLNNVLQRTTTYLNPGAGAGLYYEEETGVSGTKKKHYITAGGSTVAMITCTATPCTSTANTTTQYWHRDHLGSTSVVTNAAGGVVERLAYEPFGKRRSSNGTTDVNGTLVSSATDRGYTGHEHMDEVGLINMSGRVYDQGLGRFMSADPYIQDPSNLQSYSRYSYVWNDPLNSTDPSGYWSFSRFLRSVTKTTIFPSPQNTFNMISSQPGQAAVDRYIMSHQWAYSTGSGIAGFATAICGGCGAAAWQSYYSYQGTGSMTEAYKAGAIEMGRRYAFEMVGSFIPALAYPILNAAGHAAVGCIFSELANGDCKNGAASAGLPALAGNFNLPYADSLPGQMLIGGTVSHVSGGDFSEGALMAAIGYGHNQCRHGYCDMWGPVRNVWEGIFGPPREGLGLHYAGTTLNMNGAGLGASASYSAQDVGYLSFGKAYGMHPGGDISFQYSLGKLTPPESHSFYQGAAGSGSFIGPWGVGVGFTTAPQGGNNFRTTVDLKIGKPGFGFSAERGACFWNCP